jgi:orotidine-5'-phosphate decarboxylase
MAAYADAFLRDSSPLAADAVTVSPFLGFGSLAPVIDAARETGRGVFVLALTSNPEGAQVQHAVGADGRSVAQALLDDVRAANDEELGATGEGAWGSLGVVVGATVGDVTGVAPRLAVRGPILAPGIGAQGAGPADLARVFGPALRDVLASTSREVLGAGALGGAATTGNDPTARTTALREAAAGTLAAVRAALTGNDPALT